MKYFCFWVVAAIQVVGQSISPVDLARTDKEPANAWQLMPGASKPLPTNGTALANRDLRDAYMDKVYGAAMPVEQLAAHHLSTNYPSEILQTGSSGIPTLGPREIVIVGTFDSSDVVLTQTHRAVYSEMHIAVDRVVYPANSAIRGMLDALVPGGVVVTPGGTVVSYKVRPDQYGLSLTHKYLLFLRHIEAGDYYLPGYSIAIVNGKAFPNSPDAANAVLEGSWPFSSLSENALASEVAGLLGQRNQIHRRVLQ